ncbi:MAG: hypothetical protein RMI79_06005 [Nitrososphaerota archaeon]|nr:hypothetical protein [Nitrososphaerota archaeon]
MRAVSDADIMIAFICTNNNETLLTLDENIKRLSKSVERSLSCQRSIKQAENACRIYRVADLWKTHY